MYYMQMQTSYMGLGPAPGPMGGLPGPGPRVPGPAGPGPARQPPHGPGPWAQAHVRSLHLDAYMFRYTYMYIVTIYV